MFLKGKPNTLGIISAEGYKEGREGRQTKKGVPLTRPFSVFKLDTDFPGQRYLNNAKNAIDTLKGAMPRPYLIQPY